QFLRNLDPRRPFHAILGHRWATPPFIEHCTADARTQRRLHGSRELRHAFQKRLAGGFIERNLLGCHGGSFERRKDQICGREVRARVCPSMPAAWSFARLMPVSSVDDNKLRKSNNNKAL